MDWPTRWLIELRAPDLWRSTLLIIAVSDFGYYLLMFRRKRRTAENSFNGKVNINRRKEKTNHGQKGFFPFIPIYIEVHENKRMFNCSIVSFVQQSLKRGSKSLPIIGTYFVPFWKLLEGTGENFWTKKIKILSLPSPKGKKRKFLPQRNRWKWIHRQKTGRRSFVLSYY